MTERPRVLMAVFNALDFDGRVQRSAEALSEVADVTVLALDAGRGFKPERYRLVTVDAKPGEFGSNKMMHLRFLRTLITVARRERPDVVYAHDFFLSVSGWLAARLSGARYIYDAHELIVPGSLGRSRGQFQERVWYILERLVVRRAERVIAANRERAEIMAKHYGLPRVPAAVRNITIPSQRRLADDAVRQRHPQLLRRSPKECLVVYQGDVDLDRSLGVVIDAMALLSEDYRLIVVGGGPDLEYVRGKAAQVRGTAPIEVVGKVARQDLFDILRLCDIGVMTYAYRGLNNIYCSPNKVFEYAQAGLPVVATSQPPLVTMVRDSGIGRVAGEGVLATPREMADAIVSAFATREEHKRAIPAFLSGNTWPLEAQRLRDALAEALDWRATA